MRRIYLAGPMRGRKYYNFDQFDQWRDKLAHEWEVCSPADLDRAVGFDPFKLPAGHDWTTVPEGFSLSDAVQRDVAQLVQCDAIGLLPGWQDSRGARAERAVAEWLGIEILELEPESVLAEAERITGGDRQAQYGPPNQDFRRTADAWRALFGWDVLPWQVAGAMVVLKLSRESHQAKRDNAVDIAGYAKCLWQCREAG